MALWSCGWHGCPDAGQEREASDPQVALDHHYRTHHQHEPHRIAGSTHAHAWAAIDARAIASGRRRGNARDQLVARAEVAAQKERRAS